MAATLQEPSHSVASFLEEVRNYLRDFAELNRLTEGVETSDRQFLWFLSEVLDDFAATPPLLGFIRLEEIPRSLVLKGVIAETLKSVAVLLLRNSLRYTDGNITVDLDSRYRELMGLANMFQQEYEPKKVAFKIALNVDRALNGIMGNHSEYYMIAGFHFGNILQ